MIDKLPYNTNLLNWLNFWQYYKFLTDIIILMVRLRFRVCFFWYESLRVWFAYKKPNDQAMKFFTNEENIPRAYFWDTFSVSNLSRRWSISNQISYFCPNQTLSKCPGGHQILHRGLKLNSKNSVGKYKRINSPGPVDFPPGS